MKAAISSLKEEKTERIVAALPVSPTDAANEIRAMADKFLCLHVTSDFMSVGQFYRDFEQVTDEQVKEILREAGAYSDA